MTVDPVLLSTKLRKVVARARGRYEDGIRVLEGVGAMLTEMIRRVNVVDVQVHVVVAVNEDVDDNVDVNVNQSVPQPASPSTSWARFPTWRSTVPFLSVEA